MELLDNYENETIRERLREYGEKAKMLNTRTELPVTRQDVTEAMKFHATDDEAIWWMTFKVIGQTFYNTAIHFKTLRAIIRNPLAYSQTLNMANGEDTNFKSEPTVKNMKELFIKEAVTSRTPIATPRTRWKQRRILQDLDEGSRNSESSSSSSDDDDDSAAVAVAGPRGSSSKKLSAKKKGKTPKGPAGRLTAGVKRTLWGDEEAASSASSGPSKKSTKKKGQKESTILEELATDAESNQQQQQRTEEQNVEVEKKDKQKKK